MEQEKESAVNYLSQNGAEGGPWGRLSRPHGGPDHTGHIQLLHSFGCFGDLGHLGEPSSAALSQARIQPLKISQKQTNSEVFLCQRDKTAFKSDLILEMAENVINSNTCRHFFPHSTT